MKWPTAVSAELLGVLDFGRHHGRPDSGAGFDDRARDLDVPSKGLR